MSEPEKKDAAPAPAPAEDKGAPAEDKGAPAEDKGAPADDAGTGDKAAPAGKGKSDCKDKKSCALREFAEDLQSPSKFFEKASTDLVNAGIKKVVGAITDKGKCVELVVKDLPSIAGTVITSMGDSASGALDKITNSIKNLFAEVGDREIKGYPDLFGPFETIYAIIIINIQNIINKIALGENANQILADPNMDSKKLFEKMMKTSGRYSDAVKEAKFQGLFKEWISNYISALLKTLEIAQPEIDRINAKIKEIISGMGSNVGESVSEALLNVIKSVISTIPIVGGILQAILAADQLGQQIIKGCTPPIAKGAGIVMPIVNGVNTQIDKLQCTGKELLNKLEPILKVPEQKGGKAAGKNTRKKINNSTKRLRFLLSRFGTRRRRRH